MTKNRIFKRFVVMLMAVTMLTACLCTSAMATEAVPATLDNGMAVISYGEMEYPDSGAYPIQPRSNYTDMSGSFKVSLQTSTRYFDGNDFHLYYETHNSAGDVGAYPDVFFVTLYRKTWLGGQTAGNKVEVSRYRACTVTWAGVGPGEYYVVFSKANDGTTQYLDYVRMYN